MIVPMKKISLVVLDKERKSALRILRKLGLLHVQSVSGSGEELDGYKANFSEIEKASLLLSDIKLSKDSKFLEQKELSESESLKKAHEVNDLFAERKELYARISQNTAELERLSKWGGVTPFDFDNLSKNGVYLGMYEIANNKYLELPEEVKTVFVNRDKGQTRFLLWSEDGKEPSSMPAEAFSVVMPEKSTRDLSSEIEECGCLIERIANKIEECCSYRSSLEKALKGFSKKVEFENLYTGMDGEETLSWLTGYLPSSDVDKLKKVAAENSWAVGIEDPAEDDVNVPTKLKNNKLVSLIYPVTDFLGTVPGYHEYDISGWFLLYFVVFFAMIWGDAGYGLLLTFGGLLGIVSAKSKKKAVSPAIALMTLLGLATAFWGVFTCNWFGMPLEMVPDVLENLSFAPLSASTAAQSVEMDKWVNQNLQIFCFVLAVVQLSTAHIKGIVRYRKSLKALGELGSLCMLFGMLYVVLFMVVDGERFPMEMLLFGIPAIQLVIALLGTGFVLNFVFSSYEGSLKDSILDSCINIVSVLLGVVNVFSDIVSYIRLWAVALAGAAISATVNQMAGPLLGGFVIFAGILLLFVGHGLNMILNVLSVIVHGVRLNTLEFTSHLGMAWSGFNYEPFSEE